MTIVDKAKAFAEAAHVGQFRKHGNRPYIYHPAKVVEYLQSQGYVDEVLLGAAWLHDTVEDCEAVTYNILTKEFGEQVSRLVWEVSHPVLSNMRNRYERWQVYLIHYEAASPLGQTLKLADRYCNLKEYLDFWEYVPQKERSFLQTVYLDESNDLLDCLDLADKLVHLDLLYIINYLDELCSEG